MHCLTELQRYVRLIRTSLCSHLALRGRGGWEVGIAALVVPIVVAAVHIAYKHMLAAAGRRSMLLNSLVRIHAGRAPDVALLVGVFAESSLQTDHACDVAITIS